MKRIYILLLVSLLFSFTGCTDLLNLKPEDEMSPDSFFKTAEELELWTNAFYTQLENADSQAALNADDMVDQTIGTVMTGQRDPALERGWSWTMLRRINYYLERSHACGDIKARNHFDGVAYFMRAYFYFEKVKRYGDVPWYSKVIDSTDEGALKKPRDDRGLVMDSVMMDLDKAIAMLRDDRSTVRVTKWAAMALKSRAALYEGTFRKYHDMTDADKYLNQCAEVSREFLETSGYGLYSTGTTPYRDFFVSDDAIDEEVILSRMYSSPSANIIRHSVQFAIERGQQGFTKDFMNHYLTSSGAAFTDMANWETKGFVEETQNRDPRMEQTVQCPGYTQKGSTTVKKNLISSLTGYQMIKFVSTSSFGGSATGVSDWALFRSAEVMLNYAEAKAELGTLTQADLDMSINKIRARAKMPNLDMQTANASPDTWLSSYYTNVTQSDNTGAILEIRRERTVELAAEGRRQWDLLRWKEGAHFAGSYYGCYFPRLGEYDMDGDGSADILLWQGSKPAVEAGVTSKEVGVDIFLSEGASGYVHAFRANNTRWNENRDYLWPIPTDERTLSRGALTQNPGWIDSSGFDSK